MRTRKLGLMYSFHQASLHHAHHSRLFGPQMAPPPRPLRPPRPTLPTGHTPTPAFPLLLPDLTRSLLHHCRNQARNRPPASLPGGAGGRAFQCRDNIDSFRSRSLLHKAPDWCSKSVELVGEGHKVDVKQQDYLSYVVFRRSYVVYR